MAEPEPDHRPRELRLHGVGGSPGATLLGMDAPTDAVIVAEGGAGARSSRFLARREDLTVEGYNYGDLTYGGGMQTLWIFLLPFTLLNIGGWMHPTQRGWGKLVRAAVHVLSVALTATYVFSAAIFLVDLVGYQWSRRLACTSVTACRPGILPAQWVGVAVGLALLAGVALLLVILAGKSQGRYEKVPPPTMGAEPLADAPWGAQEGLDSPGFFWHPGSAKRLLYLHGAVLGASWLAVAALTLRHMLAAAPPDTLDLNPLLVAAGFPAAVAVGLLWLPWALSVPGNLARRRLPAAGRAGPAIACSLSFGMVIAFTSGAFLLGVQRLSAWPKRPDGLVHLSVGNAASLVDVWGGALIGIALAGGLFVLWTRLRPHGSTDDIPERRAEPGLPVDGADAAMRSAIAFNRSLAWYAHHADWPALVLALGLYLTNVVASIARSHAFHAFHGFRRFEIPAPLHPSALYTVGAYGLTLLPVLVMQLVRQGQSSRTFICTIRDVMTLFPRRFSPLAVRCYAERAVPELQGHIDHHIRVDGQPVVVSAHSQGTVLAFSALASLPDDCIRRVALVTYGSPLTTIYGTFFPQYFGQPALAKVRARVAPLGPGLLGWRNFYRRTDPIGGPVFSAPDATHLPPAPEGGTPGPEPDLELGDPMPVPPVPPVPAHPGTSSPGEAPLEHTRTPWTDIAVHSHYLCEPELKAWVVRVKEALAARES